jgi:uncharacterized protein (TIGR03083 family)
MGDDVSDWDLLAAERRDLADFAAKLTVEQWNAPTLCSDWKVRDVVAHVAGQPTASIRDVLPAIFKSGFKFNKALASLAIEAGATPQDELVASLRDNAASTRRPFGIKPAALLSDAVVHGQDIRRPLGLPRDIPEDRLRVALDDMKASSFLGTKKRVAGLNLVATDIDWSLGVGREVRGPAEAILMAMCGRTSACDDLTGEGVATLRQR